MKRPPPKASARASITEQLYPDNRASLTDRAAPANKETHNSDAVDTLRAGIHLAALWRGPRDRSRAIQFTLREFNGVEFLDIRQFVSSSGFMIPTRRGVTISVQQLGRFAEAAGTAYRKAVAMGLVTARSS
ncbi:transcriptional coactivator p15/PC4 family protein [Bradyrhizobium sp. GCM10027634]|uniref:transcriptional coactivator p15/PC4 family protein n=1 Tax=unclassified Bradyrhizobium TaxID=2631580 RepID=UPI00188CBE8C|nr:MULTISPECIES: transcriptional coactivator p15/PC4 family protein [unclassified Bradyrhizobium]MDN5003908.1 transcriptional coactivator p15/PC4 family protein [Bradyrhizobium sp. WYCCWR 12677]QOZ45431.1 hypothetical protein XH89_19535 [Bradyrhizobium sp. CCBAU 53340]